MRVVVAAVRTYESVEVARGIAEIFAEHGGISAIINKGERVLIKPNMLEGVAPDKAVTTHPEVVRAVIRQVKDAGAIPLVGDSPAIDSTIKAAERCGIITVCREEAVNLIPFEHSAEMEVENCHIVKKLEVARVLSEVDKVISVAKMKTHTFMGVTGAVKNLFGFITGMNKAQYHLRMQDRKHFAGLLIDIAALVKPVFSIVDGVIGMEGNGPRNGQPKHVGVLVGGINAYAVDAVMADIMGMDWRQLPVSQLASAKKLLPAYEKIEIVGTGKEIKSNFIPSRSMENLDGVLPSWLVRLGRRQFIARPGVRASCIGCGRCVEHCPPKAMVISRGKAVIDYTMCIRCYCCQELCPKDAIEVKHGPVLSVIRRLRR